MNDRRTQMMPPPAFTLPKTPKGSVNWHTGVTDSIQKSARFTKLDSTSRTSRVMQSFRSTLGGGLSLAGRPSQLSLAVAPSGKPITKLPKVPHSTDDRNLRDNPIKSRIQKRIFEFLQALDVSFPYSMELLKNPKSNDFKNIFNAIVQQFQPGYALGQVNIQIEDEVPKFLTSLGYPYPMKRSMLQTIGAQHTWPHLLGALDWLIDFVELEQSHPRPELPNKLAYDYVVKCHKKADIQGGQMQLWEFDDQFFEPEYQAYKRMIFDEGSDQQFDAVRAEHFQNNQDLNIVQTKIKEYKSEISEMDNLICEHNMDIDEYKNYIEEAKISISRIDELNNEVLNKINNIREQLTEVQQANARKEAQIAQQTMSRDQVMDINIKRKTLSEEKKRILGILEEIDEKRSQLQPAVFKQRGELITEVETIKGRLCLLINALLPENIRQETQTKLNGLASDQIFIIDKNYDWMTELIDQLLNVVENQLEKQRHSEDEIASKCEESRKEIQKFETLLEKKRMEYEISETELQRKVEDSLKLLNETKIARDAAFQRHNHARGNLEAQNHLNEGKQREVVRLCKLFVDYKQHLQRLYEEQRQETLLLRRKLVLRQKNIKHFYTRYAEIFREALNHDFQQIQKNVFPQDAGSLDAYDIDTIKGILKSLDEYLKANATQ